VTPWGQIKITGVTDGTLQRSGCFLCGSVVFNVAAATKRQHVLVMILIFWNA